MAQVGSGKTTVLVHKLLVALSRGAAPEQVAVLTFTTHAARELRQRVADMLGDDAARRLCFLGTFHAVALAILRRTRERVAVIDPEAREDLWRELIAEHGLRVCYRKRLGRRLETLAQGRTRFGAMKREDDLSRLEALYREHKRTHGLYDFDDLIREARADLVERPLDPALRWILIDELQDTNHEQLRFVSALAPGDAQWFAVGDPNQVIYSWRGNTPQAFSQLGRRPGAVCLELPSNYRSTSTILSEAEQLLPGRRLVPTRDAGAPLRLVVHHDAVSEARYLAQRLPELAQGAWHEVGILARTRRQLTALETALRELGVPVISPPARANLAVRWVRRLLTSALARTPGAVGLLSDEDYGLLPKRLLRKAPRGDWAELLEHLRRKRLARLEPADQGAIVRAIRFCARLPDLARWIEGDPLPTATDVRLRLELDEAIGRTRSRFDRDGRRVQSALEAWLSALPELPPEGRSAGLLAALRRDPAGEARPAAPREGVRLLTFHAAKGLEFRHLLLSGLNAGLVPLARSEFNPAELREERRLFYVALTRAKDTLELSYHRQPERPDVQGEPSPFLAGLSTVTPDLSPPAAATATAAPGLLAVGAQVVHRRYGAGEVLAVSPRVTVRFASGERGFLPKLASATLKLEI